MTTLETLQQTYANFLPTMRRMAVRRFLHLDPDKREEMLQVVLTLCWRYAHDHFRKGKEVNEGVLKAILWYAIPQAKCGRSITGKIKARDVLECRLRGRAEFQLLDLHDLIGKRTPVVDQVVFRIDMPRFLATLKPRQQQMAYELATGQSTTEVAEKHGLTLGRISQFRREFKRLHDDFFGE